MTKSKLFSLQLKDGIKAFFMAVGTGAVVAATQTMKLGVIPDPKLILISALSAGGVYILKNWLTNSEDKILQKEPEKRL